MHFNDYLLKDNYYDIKWLLLPWVEAYDSWPSRKEHLEIRREICYIRAASQLPGSGPTNVDDALQGGPLMWMMPLHANQNLIMIMQASR